MTRRRWQSGRQREWSIKVALVLAASCTACVLQCMGEASRGDGRAL